MRLAFECKGTIYVAQVAAGKSDLCLGCELHDENAGGYLCQRGGLRVIREICDATSLRGNINIIWRKVK